MIMTGEMIIEQFYSKKGYSNPRMKLSRDVKAGKFIKLKRNLYLTDPSVPKDCLAQAIYGPSYISFDYALSYYDMIPEYAVNITSATYGKHKNKSFKTNICSFYYSDVPTKVFHEEVVRVEFRGYSYYIATREKALCDKLYKKPPVTRMDEFEEMLLDDMRLDEIILFELNVNTIEHLSELYACRNIRMLSKYLRRLHELS